ncbi:MAG: nitrogenase component 1 [archaeon]|nr:nitrogenase component 1 [archaeon]
MSLENDRPESLLGLMMALEGVEDSYTIVHGPTGCKYYPASVSENMFRDRGQKPNARNLLIFSDRYFFAQPRLPCTYLDMGMFVTGAMDRLEDLYGKVGSMSPSLIGIINTPGASLIGEDISDIKGDIPTVAIDHCRYTGSCAEGFQDGILAILKTVKPEKSEKREGVNLVGIGMMHLNWEDTIDDLKGLLELCGIKVNTVIGAGWDVDDIRRSASAELNVLVYPEYGDRIAEFYTEDYGIPSFKSPEEVPIGFASLEHWICGICDRLGKDPSKALKKIKAMRKRTASKLQLMESMNLLPKGRTFSLFTDGSTAYAVSDFLYSYLGMVPAAITCPSDTPQKKRTLERFRELKVPFSEDAEHIPTDVFIASGGLCASAMSRKVTQGTFVIEYPSDVFISVSPEPALGLGGTVRLLDAVLNTIAERQRFR